MLLLGFLLIIAVSLTLWAALTLGTPPVSVVAVARAEGLAEGRATVRSATRRPSNDDVRGARARVRPSEGAHDGAHGDTHDDTHDDAFERFLRSDARRDESEF